MVYKTLMYGLCGGSLWLLSFLLFFNLPKVNEKANLFLGICSFFLASVFVQFLLEVLNLHGNIMLLSFLECGRWAILPSFFVAINLYISPDRSPYKYFLHFIPTLLLIPLLSGGNVLPDFLVYAIRYFLYIQLFVYGIWTYVLLRKHRALLKKISADFHGVDLQWVLNIWWGILLLGVLSLVARFVPALSPMVDGLYLLGILFFSYYALSQTAIYQVVDKQVPVIKAAVLCKDKERLTAEQVGFFKERLLNLMDNDKPYLDPILTLPLLADKIGLSVHELSYVLNTGVDLNFYQFVNAYRIRYAQQLLNENTRNDYNIQEIFIRSGFNSKTTFYTAFKQIVGMTPKQYLQQQ
ncbi:AraC family transcriptional regulator [Sphingobacterium sp. DN00404]|uniref:AraC family transcriptional regulator n=1 Tax=Sphingobacterium micropteri TaxID=2763501 RepID=A0ABR7YLH3_9SPHI|nr:helix-turn-helix domain-containing protein [Sphingobacterium micropteri]MBD1432081.1 AraC family transcriptional regulator [Sphingobacterium micropteri]